MTVPQLDSHVISRFWSKVSQTTGCWEWRGGCPTPGYGKFSLTHTKSINAHRLMWLLKFGNIPKGICVLHRCDNRWCVNPKHLFLGTKGDNARDCVSKNRNSCGERNGLAKLTSKEVIE